MKWLKMATSVRSFEEHAVKHRSRSIIYEYNLGQSENESSQPLEDPELDTVLNQPLENPELDTVLSQPLEDVELTLS